MFSVKKIKSKVNDFIEEIADKEHFNTHVIREEEELHKNIHSKEETSLLVLVE